MATDYEYARTVAANLATQWQGTERASRSELLKAVALATESDQRRPTRLERSAIVAVLWTEFGDATRG